MTQAAGFQYGKIESELGALIGMCSILQAVFTKVLVEEEQGGTTYSVQYYARTKADLQTYQNHYAAQLQADGLKRFGDKVLAFRTELHLIDEFKVTQN